MEKWSRLLLLLRCVEYELRSEFFIRLTTENCKSFRFRIHSNCCVMVLLVNAKVEHTHTVCGTCFDCMGFRIWNVRLPFAMCADHVATCIKSSAKWNSLFFCEFGFEYFAVMSVGMYTYMYYHPMPRGILFLFSREKSLSTVIVLGKRWLSREIGKNREKYAKNVARPLKTSLLCRSNGVMDFVLMTMSPGSPFRRKIPRIRIDVIKYCRRWILLAKFSISISCMLLRLVRGA